MRAMTRACAAVGRAEAGRAEMGQAEMGRAEMGRAEMGRAEVGWSGGIRSDIEHQAVGVLLQSVTKVNKKTRPDGVGPCPAETVYFVV